MGPSGEDVASGVLAGDGMTLVVRVGDTVRRPVRPFTASVHSYLAHIRSRGFLGAPEPLGYDEDGREVLSFVPGEVPAEDLPGECAGPEVLVALGRLIRGLHDAAADFQAAPDAVWGSVPGAVPAGVVPLFARPELISHQDYFPGNVVFRDGLPAALIDFDLTRPTSYASDLVNALYWWAPLMDPVDRPAALRGADSAARVRIVADAYGVGPELREQLVPVAVQRARNSVLTMRAAAEEHPVFRRWWDEGLKDKLPRAAAWLATEAARIEAALR